MAILEFEEESIINNFKNWNLDRRYFDFREEHFKFDGNLKENIIFIERTICILEYYFDQLEKAKEEIKGIFTKDEIFEMLNHNSGHSGPLYDNKEFFIDSCCSESFDGYLFNNPDIKAPLFDKLNKLTEMQVHALRCIIEGIRREFDIKELFGCKNADEKGFYDLY